MLLLTALIIIGSIILVLFLLLLFPVKAYLKFDDEFKIKFKYLFLSYKLDDKKIEEDEEEIKEKTESKGFKDFIKRVIKKENGVSGFLNLLIDLIKKAVNSSKKIISHISIKKFDLYVCVGANDPAESAIRYGQVSAGIYSATAALFSIFKCRKKAVSVDMNYDSTENTVLFEAIISIPLLFLLTQGIIIVKDLLPYIKKFK